MFLWKLDGEQYRGKGREKWKSLCRRSAASMRGTTFRNSRNCAI